MPAVIDTPELIEIEQVGTHNLPIERPQRRAARPGFWRTRMHRITTPLTSPPREGYTPVYSVPRPFETPMDSLVRKYPSLVLHALAII
jgi:hypothetical protein